MTIRCSKNSHKLLGKLDKFAHGIVKKLMLVWDPDFTKVTYEEAQQIKAAEESGFISEKEIDWDNLEMLTKV